MLYIFILFSLNVKSIFQNVELLRLTLRILSSGCNVAVGEVTDTETIALAEVCLQARP